MRIPPFQDERIRRFYEKAWDKFMHEWHNTTPEQRRLNKAKQALNEKPMHKTLLRKEKS